MKTSISDIIATEQYLRGEMCPQEEIVFEARVLIDEQLREGTMLHRIVHRISKLYHRRRMKAELERLHVRLLSDPINVRLRESVALLKP